MERIDSKFHQRQIELMKKRFDVDEENKIVKLNIRYEKAGDLVLDDLETKVPTFNREIFPKIKETIEDFPSDYHVDVNFKIHDYEGYKPEEILDGFNDAVELTHYSGNKENRKKWVQIIFLLVAGILILALMAKGLINQWYPNETTQSVFNEVFDITSWVFIWEAVGLLFLSPSEIRKTSIVLLLRLHNVSFLDENDKVLASEDYRESYNLTVKENRIKTVGKYLLLLSGAAFFALGLMDIISNIVSIPNFIVNANEEGFDASAYLAIFIIQGLTFVISLIEMFSGLIAIFVYAGRVSKFHKMVLPFGIIAFLVELFLLIVLLINGSFENITAPIFGIIVSLSYFLGALFVRINAYSKRTQKN